MFYTYVIKRQGERGYYIGYTADLRKRLKQHSARQNCKLLYYEAYLTESLARRREYKLKQFGGAWSSLRERLDIK